MNMPERVLAGKIESDDFIYRSPPDSQGFDGKLTTYLGYGHKFSFFE